MQAGGAFARGKQSRDRSHLGIAIHLNAAHDVVRGGPDFHRLLRDVEVGQLLELVIHAGQLFLDVLDRAGNLFLDPGDVEEHAAMRAPAAGLHFAVDAAGHVIAREQFRRTTGAFIALRIAPAFLFVVGRLALIIVRNIVEHEALALVIPQHAAFAADALGHQDAFDARRPHHSCGMELNKFHIEQRGSGLVGQRLAVGGVLPTVAGHLEGAAHAAGREHHRFGMEHLEAPTFAIVSECTRAAISVRKQGEDSVFGVDVDPLMNAVILQGANHFETRAVAHVSQARIAVSAEVALQDSAVLGAVKDRAPGFEFVNPRRRLLGVQFSHAAIVQVLAAAHGVGKVNPPVVAVIDVAHGRRHAAFGHYSVGLAQHRLGDRGSLAARRGRLNSSPQTRAARANH